MKTFIVLTVCVTTALCQVNFGGSSTSSSSASSNDELSLRSSEPAPSSSNAAESGDTRFFGLFHKPKPKPKPQQSYRPTNNCGRRKRQADEDEKTEGNENTRLDKANSLFCNCIFRFFLKPKPKPVWVGCTCGKRKRQAEEGVEEGAGGNTR